MLLTEKELHHLQDLCCLSLSPQEEHTFLSQLENIIGFLGTMTNVSFLDTPLTKQHLLQPIAGVRQFWEPQLLLKNSTHGIINNCIVVKSALDT